MSGARWVVLGSGTAVPRPNRAPTGHFLRLPAGDFLVDPGPGALHRFVRAGGRPERLRGVLLSHHHPDHCLDLAAVLFAWRNPDEGSTWPPLRILGGPGTARLVERLDEAFGGVLDLPSSRLEVRELGEERLELAEGVVVTTHRVAHTPASLALRFEIRVAPDARRVVTWSGDSDVCAGLVRAARSADWFLVEAAMPDHKKVRGHLTPTEAAGVAAEAQARRLVLTHFYPAVDVVEARRSAERRFPGEVWIAEDGLVLPLDETEAIERG